MFLEPNQRWAIFLFVILSVILIFREGMEISTGQRLISLFLCVVCILFYRLLAFICGLGFLASLASDQRANHHHKVALVFFWCVYAVLMLFHLFNARLY